MVFIINDLFFVITSIVCVLLIFKKEKNKGQVKIENVYIEKYSNVLIMILFLLFFINLIFKLGEVPRELHVDEAGAFYDAICLSKYGTDRYLNKWPVYLINFGGGQSALYAYLAAIMIKIGGANMIAFRAPAVLLSLISCLLLYQTVEKNKGKKEAVFVTFLFVISPWNIMKSRWGLDCNLMSSMIVIAIWSLLKASHENKNYLYVISGILFGITLYTYAISYIVLPILLVVWIIYMLMTQNMRIKNVLYFGVALAIFAIPLVLVIAYNSGWIENVHLPIVTIPKLWFYRGSEISVKNISSNMKNVLDILFVKDFLNYNSIEQFGTLYIMSIPFVICGVVKTVKNVIEDIQRKEISLDLIMLVLFIIEFCVGICLFEENINKVNAIYIPLIYFAGIWLSYIFDHFKYASILVFVLYMISYGMFAKSYFVDFAREDLMYSELSIIEASKKVEEIGKDTIYVENCLNQTYIYTLVATPISPYDFSDSAKIENGIVTEYGKYKFALPDEIDGNAVYIVKNDINKMNELMEKGFSSEQYNEFYILWQ